MSSIYGQLAIQAGGGTTGGLLAQRPGTSGSNSGGNEGPAWIQNPKKRTIPNHLIPKRKPGFQITSTANDKKDDKSKGDFLQSNGSSPFNLLSFGSSHQRKSLNLDNRANSSLYDTTAGDITKYDETMNNTMNDDFNAYGMDDDLPPSRSIYDLNDEILLSLDKPNSQHNESFINKDPKDYNNIFNKNDSKVKAISSGEKVEDKLIHPLQKGESAILVFGYPESMANQVIQRFQEFGTILEDFDVNKNKKFRDFSAKQRETILPCFSGKSWVKITYDNPASALDSLQENGTIFNGVLLGVIPYTKDSIEKLQNRKLTENEDIGGGINLVNNLDNTHKVDNAATNGDTSDVQASYVSRLEIKDGSNLFLKSDSTDPSKPNPDNKSDNENLGAVGTVFKYIFGFNEL